MTDLRQRQEPIRSRKLLNSARGAECAFHFPGICNHDRETTVSAHLSDDIRGAARKADDLMSVHACSACHDFFDRRLWLGTDIERDIHWYALRALMRTLRARVDASIVIIPRDVVALLSDKPTRARKPKAERKAIPQRVDAWPEARPIPSRPFPSRKQRPA